MCALSRTTMSDRNTLSADAFLSRSAFVSATLDEHAHHPSRRADEIGVVRGARRSRGSRTRSRVVVRARASRAPRIRARSHDIHFCRDVQLRRCGGQRPRRRVQFQAAGGTNGMWWTFSSDVTLIFHVLSHKTEAATAKTIARRRPLPPHPKPPPRLRRVFVGVENFGFSTSPHRQSRAIRFQEGTVGRVPTISLVRPTPCRARKLSEFLLCIIGLPSLLRPLALQASQRLHRRAPAPHALPHKKRQRRRNNSPSTVAESVYSSCLTKPRALVTQPGTHGSSCVKSITTVCASTLVLCSWCGCSSISRPINS